MTTPKPPCAARGTHAGQPWQCARDGKDKARHLGHVCPAHYRQWERAGYPDAVEFRPIRPRQPASQSTVLQLYLPVELADGLRGRAAAERKSIAALCRPALARLLEDDS